MIGLISLTNSPNFEVLWILNSFQNMIKPWNLIIWAVVDEIKPIKFWFTIAKFLFGFVVIQVLLYQYFSLGNFLPELFSSWKTVQDNGGFWIFLITFPFSKTSWICTELKLDNPIDLTSPFSTNFSMANQVSVGWVSTS